MAAAKLLILAGPPCSGKSALADPISKTLDFRWLQADRILSELIPDSCRTKSDRDLAYRAMHLLAEELLRCSRSVVLDATYGPSVHRESVEALVETLAIPLYLIECQVSPETAVSHFKSRHLHPAQDLTEERVRDLAHRYCYSGRGLTLPAEQPHLAKLQRVDVYLREAKPLRVDGSWSAAARGYSA